MIILHMSHVYILYIMAVDTFGERKYRCIADKVLTCSIMERKVNYSNSEI